ncbi:hypothetical protein F5X98DRAFT_347720 [Xylaria grammica]|nr:hypothetical protein F5X98DRAFT_347720 [Xylaria grammica]
MLSAPACLVILPNCLMQAIALYTFPPSQLALATLRTKSAIVKSVGLRNLGSSIAECLMMRVSAIRLSAYELVDERLIGISFPRI